MAKFLLKAGSAEIKGVRYNHGKPGMNVVESDENLAALDPHKWERVNTWEEMSEEDKNEGRRSNRNEMSPEPETLNELNQPRTSSSKFQPTGLGATTSQRVNPEGRTIEEMYGPLDKLDVKELRGIAEAESVDLPKTLKPGKEKEEILKALKSHK